MFEFHLGFAKASLKKKKIKKDLEKHAEGLDFLL